MTFTDKEIKEQRAKVNVLEYLVDGLTDDYQRAANRLEEATVSCNTQIDILKHMLQNKETK